MEGSKVFILQGLIEIEKWVPTASHSHLQLGMLLLHLSQLGAGVCYSSSVIESVF